MHAQSQAIPPKIKPAAPTAPAVFAIIVLGGAAAGVGAVVFFFNPGTHGFYPVCLFHQMTGLNCPGCGMTRGLYALLHGNLLAALKDNALFVLTLAAAAVWGWRLTLKKLRGQAAAFSVSPKILWAFLVLAVVFAALRNLPGFAWLSP